MSAGAGEEFAKWRPGMEKAKKWAASPLLVDPDVPSAVVSEVVPTTTDTAGDERVAVLVELNLRAGIDPDEVKGRFLEVFRDTVGNSGPDPRVVTPAYVRCLLRRGEIRSLLEHDRAEVAEGSPGPQTIFRIWPDYILRPLIDRSASTVKADAAGRTYGASGAGIVWAVLDTGVQADHPHFSAGTLDDPLVRDLHRDFTHLVRGEQQEPDPGSSLVDEDGHGTHVAGIIAGRLPADHEPRIAERSAATGPDDQDLPRWATRSPVPGGTLAGIAAQARLVSLKVLDAGSGEPRTTSSAVIAAIEHVRRVNAWGRLLRIHGINLSFGCPWSYHDYAAGQSPLCRELNLLTGTGVVAVVSAGNSGYGLAEQGTGAQGVLSTITDPGNADRVITVGSTHRDRPHTYGVTYASSKGPTLDGRLKPDVVAPGDGITSCASGRLRDRIPVFQDVQEAKTAFYAEETGTSMAAPHVSGVIASFLSVRSEFIGYPDELKRLFCETAISLGRDRFFEGHGLVDLMGALSRV